MAEAPITGLVLAGGAARRLQAAHPGADKGLLPLAGRPLIAWVIDNLAPQVQGLVISANRHLDDYRQLGHPVLPDLLPDMPGPLAGIHAALSACPTEWLAVSACDTPFLPPDWVTRLQHALTASRAPIAYAHDPDQPHPLVALLHRNLLPSLDAFLKAGNHRVRQWYGQHGAQAVPFPDPQAFQNLNTPEEWQAAESRLGPPVDPHPSS